MDQLAFDLVSTVVACRRELLKGLIGGVLFSLAMYLSRPIVRRRAQRDAVQHLLYVERQRVSTYLLVGLAFGCWAAGILVLIPLGATQARVAPAAAFFAILLFMVGLHAAVSIDRVLARRLAGRIVAMRGYARPDEFGRA